MHVVSSSCRPLYYDWPDSAGAYQHKDSYHFVDGLLVAPMTSPQGNSTEIATRALWLPPGFWVDTVSGVELSSPMPDGRTFNYSATLWEVPVFARSGTMLALAPEPGVPLDTLDPSLAQPALGGAAREPALLSWEVWLGTAASGSGRVWEESRGSTNVSYVLSSDGATLQLKMYAERPGVGRSHRFELQNLPPPTSVAPCSSATSVAGTSYDGRSLAINIHASFVCNDPATCDPGCITVKFDAPLNSAAVSALRAVPYKSLRQRLHVIKQRFDNLTPRPGSFLMALVAASKNLSMLILETAFPSPSLLALVAYLPARLLLASFHRSQHGLAHRRLGRRARADGGVVRRAGHVHGQGECGGGLDRGVGHQAAGAAGGRDGQSHGN